MRTVHCARALYTALATVDGIEWADVVVGRATIAHDGRATEPLLAHAAALTGFTIVAVHHRRGALPLL